MQSDETPFCIIEGIVTTINYLLRRYFAYDANPAVTLFLCRKPKGLITHVFKMMVGNAVVVGFDFLKTDDIRLFGGYPIHKAFADGRTDAVYIVGEDADGHADENRAYLPDRTGMAWENFGQAAISFIDTDFFWK